MSEKEDKRFDNKFWKHRSKHGRDKIFSDHNIMLLAGYEYFEKNSKIPWYKKEGIKSGDLAGKTMDIETERPLTILGLTQFWGVNRHYLSEFLEGIKGKPEEKDFSAVISHLKDVIERQQIEGAMIGAFNANLVSRLNGLADKTENEHKVVVEQITGMEFK